MKAQHFVSQKEIIENIKNYKIIIVGERVKKIKKIMKKEMNVGKSEQEEEQEVELFDSIVLEPYPE